jgi:hypothetical protein
LRGAPGAQLIFAAVLAARVILGFSLVRKRVYVDAARLRDYLALRRYRRAGYEIAELGGRPEYASFITARRLCAGPAPYTARHCFGLPAEGVEGRGYVIRETGETGRVVRDYSPPLHNIIVWLARLFGLQLGGVRDVVMVDKARLRADGQAAVVTGRVTGTGHALLTAVPEVDPVSLVGKRVEIVTDIPEEGRVECAVNDYGIIDIYLDSMPWPHEVLVASCGQPVEPAHSGALAVLRE